MRGTGARGRFARKSSSFRSVSVVLPRNLGLTRPSTSLIEERARARDRRLETYLCHGWRRVWDVPRARSFLSFFLLLPERPLSVSLAACRPLPPATRMRRSPDVPLSIDWAVHHVQPTWTPKLAYFSLASLRFLLYCRTGTILSDDFIAVSIRSVKIGKFTCN